MSKWRPCKRRNFIKKLMKLGFNPPEPGARHFYMRHKTYTLTFPNNREYSVFQVKMLLKEIESALEKKLPLEEWQKL